MVSPIRYIVFLRGINVGGNAIVKMSELTEAFSSLGFENVKTYINSGNVLFDTSETDEKKLIALIEKQLAKRFGRELKILLRTQKKIQEFIEENPFEKFDLTDKSLYFIVSFLSEMPQHDITLPYSDDELGFEIAALTDREIFLVLDREKLAKTGNAMKFIGKAFPVLSTTRTWKVITKLTSL